MNDEPSLADQPHAGMLGQPTPAQQAHLEQLGSRQAEVAIYLINGIRLQGTIVGFDKQTLLLASGPSKQLINKSAVSTIVENMPNDAGQALSTSGRRAVS